MADTDNEELDTTEGDNVEAGGGKKKLIIIIAAVCLLLSVAAGAYFMFFAGGDSSDVSEEAAEQEGVSEQANENIENVYVAMPLPFVFNIQDGKRTRLVQIKVQLMVRSSEYATLTKKHIPLLESTIVRVFSSTGVEQMRSPEGKEKLKQDLLTALNEATSKVEQKELISSVLFTGFVLQ